jgi:hypothetical protein
MHPVAKATGYPAKAGRFAATQLRGRLPPTKKYFLFLKMNMRLSSTK